MHELLYVLIDTNGKRRSCLKRSLWDCLVWTHSKGRNLKLIFFFFMLAKPNISWCHPYQHLHPSCSIPLPACATTHTADVPPLPGQTQCFGDSLFGLCKPLETTHSMHTFFPQVTVWIQVRQENKVGWKTFKTPYIYLIDLPGLSGSPSEGLFSALLVFPSLCAGNTEYVRRSHRRQENEFLSGEDTFI